MRVIINAGFPFAAEEFTVDGIDFLIEGIPQVFEVTFIVINAILDPDVKIVTQVTQRGSDLKILVGIHIGHPEILDSTNGVRSFVIRYSHRDIRFPAQTFTQVNRVIDRDDLISQGLESLLCACQRNRFGWFGCWFSDGLLGCRRKLFLSHDRFRCDGRFSCRIVDRLPKRRDAKNNDGQTSGCNDHAANEHNQDHDQPDNLDLFSGGRILFCHSRSNSI